MKEGLVFDEVGGRIVVPHQTLASIVSTAVESVGARIRRRPRRSLELDLSAEPLHVEVGIVAPSDAVLPLLAESVQSSVCRALSLMCALEGLSVDVTVEEVD